MLSLSLFEFLFFHLYSLQSCLLLPHIFSDILFDCFDSFFSLPRCLRSSIPRKGGSV